jgi:hypothetical protein
MAVFNARRDGKTVYFTPSHEDYKNYLVLFTEKRKKFTCQVLNGLTVEQEAKGVPDIYLATEWCRQKVYECQGFQAQFPQDISSLETMIYDHE